MHTSTILALNEKYLQNIHPELRISNAKVLQVPELQAVGIASADDEGEVSSSVRPVVNSVGAALS